jgi:hypothetical protein
MIEEGREWELHVRTRRHRKLIRKQKQLIATSENL